MLGRPLASAPLASLLAVQMLGTQTATVRYASESFVTRDTDNPASTFIAGRLNRGLEFGRELTNGPEGQFGALIDARFSEVELNNSDGALDGLINDYYADGRSIRLKIGAKEITSAGQTSVKPFSSFATVYQTIAGQWYADRRDVVKLRVQTLAARLQDRLQLRTYSGAGGKDGTADMAGRTRPLAFGIVPNVTGQLVDGAIGTYQFHSRSLQAFDALYDQGIAVPFDADYPTYDALAAAPLAAGTYATAKAEGYARVVPLGSVTADLRGDNVGGYVDTHAGVVGRFVGDFGPLTPSDIDGVSFTAYAASQPAEMGIYFEAGDQTRIEEAVDRVAFAGGAFAGQDRSGLYRVQQLAVPAITPHWVFTDREIIDIEREPLPYGVPWDSWGVGYQKNWTVQKAADLAAGVSQERRQFLEAEYRYAFAASAAIALSHGTTSSCPPLKQTLFYNQADAATETARLLAFYALGRALYRVTVKTALFSIELGQTIRLTFPRWNLHSGRNCVVVAVADDGGTRQTEIRVFG